MTDRDDFLGSVRVDIEKRIADRTATLEDFYMRETIIRKSREKCTQLNGGTGVCWYCGGRLLWGNDFDYGDIYGEGKGIVTQLTCMDCGADAEFTLKEEEDKE